MYDETNTQNYYADQETAAQFEQKRFYGAFGRYLKAHDADFYANNPKVAYATCHTALELGAGSGRITEAMVSRQPHLQITATDRSEPMLAQLKQRPGLAQAGQRLIIRCTPAEALAHEPTSYDLVYFARLLMHIKDWQSFLQIAAGLSRNYLLFDFPPSASLGSWGRSVLDRSRHGAQHHDKYHTYNIAQVRQVLHEVGFELVWLYRPFVLPIPVHLKIGWPNGSLAIERAFKWFGLQRLLGAPAHMVARRITPPSPTP
ncbi:class I SAM-dependent methyltransferase [Magnetococcus marinus]|nr:class I SAM-dependent methyltransferase [Magnetococcus marinus]